MGRALASICLLGLLVVQLVLGDIYLQNPRGSNNRLHESSATRTNNRRLFNSQNNARGGYNVGMKNTATNLDLTYSNPDGMATPVNPAVGFNAGFLDKVQYNMMYLERSELMVEWLVQHGCGGHPTNDPNALHCHMVIQYMCDTDSTKIKDKAQAVLLRDGSDTDTPKAPGVYALQETVDRNDHYRRNGQTDEMVLGRHESEAYYAECAARNRNLGLFTADQQMNGNSAQYTRQNPNGDGNVGNNGDNAFGNRYGLECQEERDYYPYWHPSPWRDVAYLTDYPERDCPFVLANSQNVAPKYKCHDPTYEQQQIMKHTDMTNCKVAGGNWTAHTHNLPAPTCQAAPKTRFNHLGNSADGQPPNFNWTLPVVSDLVTSGVKVYNDPDTGNTFARCVMRLRYNISTQDYDPWTTDYLSNDPTPNGGNNQDNNPQNRGTAGKSPVYTNPTIDVGNPYIDFANKQRLEAGQTPYQGLRLAINTNQFGRTFQDRSHVFLVVSQAPAVKALVTEAVSSGLEGAGKIVNLNVRGKRGNIVQTYPATEYDFLPNRLHINPTQFIHVQWTGSNTHNNNGGGDGQGGDAGQGQDGSDRHNLLQSASQGENFPLPLDGRVATMWDHLDCYDLWGVPLPTLDCQIRLATSGHFWSEADARTNFNTRNLQNELNNAPPTLRQGLLLRFKASGQGSEYAYLCTRNNNFSNRSQKGVFIVDTI